MSFARYVAWVALIFILLFVVILSTLLGHAARKTLISRQEEYAALLTENLNHQVYRRFTLPTVIGFGRIALRQTAQYERLDQVVKSTIHGLDVQKLRIFSYNGTVTYSTDKEEPGQKNLATASVMAVATSLQPIFEIDSKMPYWKAFFQFSLGKNCFILRTSAPLRIENRLNSSEPEGPIMGMLEFTKDITPDIESAIRFQQSIISLTMVSATILMILLLFFIRRAEKAVAERIKEEKRLQKELHQNEKLAGMGKVVASIAHEIRNPLGIIRSSAELLLKKSKNTDTMTTKILEAIYDESKRLSQTVSDFLDYAKPSPAIQNKVFLLHPLNQAIVFLAHDFQKRSIEVIKNDDIWENVAIFGDSALLYRAFYNILSNAAQAIESSGTLQIFCYIQEKKIKIVFQDSGPGFQESDIEKVLDPFFTTKDDGTGLGLPIVNSIITNHGGTLSLENHSGGGAIVNIELPLL